MYRAIYLFRFDANTGEIFVLAGENIEILIAQDSTWRFIINET